MESFASYHVGLRRFYHIFGQLLKKNGSAALLGGDLNPENRVVARFYRFYLKIFLTSNVPLQKPTSI